MTVQHYLTAYPAVYGQFTQAIPPQIAAVPAQREGKKKSKKRSARLNISIHSIISLSHLLPLWKFSLLLVALISMWFNRHSCPELHNAWRQLQCSTAALSFELAVMLRKLLFRARGLRALGLWTLVRHQAYVHVQDGRICDDENLLFWFMPVLWL